MEVEINERQGTRVGSARGSGGLGRGAAQAGGRERGRRSELRQREREGMEVGPAGARGRLRERR